MSMEIFRNMSGQIIKIIVDEDDTLKDIAAVLPVTLKEVLDEVNSKLVFYGKKED